MSKFICLTKILLKNGGESIINRKSRKFSKTALFAIIMIVAFISFISIFVTLVVKIYDPLKMIAQQGLILGLVIPITCLIIFFFGIFHTVNTFYFSTDIENLLPLPITPVQILGAKFMVTLVYEYLTELIFLVPILITYGIMDGGSPLYYIYCVIVFMILPVVPLAAAAVINMVIMRFTNISKHKDLFKIVGGIVAMFLALGANLYIQKLTTSTTSQDQIIRMLKQGNNSFVNIASNMFPGSRYAVNCLAASKSFIGIINMLVFLVITIVIVIIFMMMGKMLYFRGVIGISEASSSRKKISSDEIYKRTAKSSVLTAYTIKELKLLFRTPIYFMNCILMNFLWPVFLIFPFMADSNSQGQLKVGISFIQTNNKVGVVIAAAFAISIFISTTNLIAATAISREGKNVFTLKYMPIDFRQIIIGKTMPAIVMGTFSVLIILIMGVLLIKFSVVVIIFICIVCLLGIVFTSFTGILIDLTFPKLNWDTEQKAVKQNMNGVLNMVIGIAAAAIIIFVVVKFKIDMIITFAAIVILFTLIDLVLFNLISTCGVRKLSLID